MNYLVLNEQIVFDMQGYGAGTVLIVAENDNAQGGFYCRNLESADLKDAEPFEMTYGPNGQPDKEYGHNYVFIPAHAGSVHNSIKSVLREAKKYTDNNSPYYI